jgi:hypothetical protein
MANQNVKDDYKKCADLDLYFHIDSHSVEYDDEAILDFNPDIKRDVERRACLAKLETPKGAKGSTDTATSSHEASTKSEQVRDLSSAILADIRSKFVHKLNRADQSLATMKTEVNQLKEEYDFLGQRLSDAMNQQQLISKTRRALIDELNLIIYENKVIKHLVGASRQMKLFECHVAADRRVIFVDPDDIGTDVDIGTGVDFGIGGDFGSKIDRGELFCPHS